MKEHKKLYKSGKLWMTATIMAFAAGATMATTNVAHAQTTGADQGTEQTSSADAIAKQQQKVNDDQTAVNNAQSAVNDTNDQLTDANQKLTDAKQAQSDAQAKIDQATTDQNDAKTTMDQLEQKAKDAKKATLDQHIQTAQSSLDQTNSDIQNKQSQVTDLTNQKKELQDQQGQSTSTNPNIVSVPNGNIDTTESLLENAARNNLWADNDVSKSNGNVIPQNLYVTPDDNKNQTIPDSDNTNAEASVYDPYFNQLDQLNITTGMTDAQKEEMAILLLNEINHIRAQRGLAPFIMTKEKYDQAQVRAAQASAAAESHDENDIISAFGKEQFENVGYIDASDTNNMLSLLYNANATISNMLNADASSNWGHRKNFLEPGTGQNAAFGFHYMIDSNTGKPIYVMTFDFNGGRASNETSENMMGRINTYAAEGPVSSGTTTVDNTDKINDLDNQISDLNNSISSDQTTATNLQNQISNLKDQENNLSFVESDLSADDQATYDAARTKNNQAVIAKSAAQRDLETANTNVSDAQQNVDDLNSQLAAQKATLQAAQKQLAEDQNILAAMQDQPTTPTHQTDAEKYTDLEADALNPVTVVQNSTSVDAPALDASAIIPDTNSAVMALSVTSPLYPNGTTAVWADPSAVVNDAKTVGNHNESVYLHFPDGSNSATFTAPNILIVTPATTPSTGDDTNPSTGDHTGDNTNPSTGDDHTGDNTPTTPTTGDNHQNDQGQAAHRPGNDNQPANNDQTAATELPAGSRIVNNHVVDANGNVIPGWTVVDGQAVKTATNANNTTANSAKDAKQLPQTGNDEAVAATGLGVAAMASLLGLGVLNKKRA